MKCVLLQLQGHNTMMMQVASDCVKLVPPRTQCVLSAADHSLLMQDSTQQHVFTF